MSKLRLCVLEVLGLAHMFVGEPSKVSTINTLALELAPSHLTNVMNFGSIGCKIKALRAKTNTYIKTPVRGEEPVFSISGRPDHVNSAKFEIMAAAEHFSQIRAARPQASTMTGSDKVTIFVRVPYRVVGLVVGPRGSTVKRIQQLTRTFIVTPSRDKEPCFEVRGTPENVERARKEIESYIVYRTGNKTSLDEEACDALYNSSNSASLLAQQLQCQLGSGSSPFQCADSQRHPSSNGNLGFSGGGFELVSAKGNGSFAPEVDGMGPQWNIPMPTIFSGMRFTPPDTSYHPMSAPLLTAEKVFDSASSTTTTGGGSGNKQQPLSPTGSYESTSSDGGLGVNSPKQSPLVQKRVVTPCCMCRSNEDMAALVPCGHNMFCQTCAHYIACSTGTCPLCNTQVINVMHI